MLGKQLQLFTISNDVGPGLCLWLPKGAMIRSQLEEFIKQELAGRGYLPVYTPHIGRIQMYQTSGHFPYYMESQFPPFYLDPFMQSVQQIFALLFQEKIDDGQIRRPVRGVAQAQRRRPDPRFVPRLRPRQDRSRKNTRRSRIGTTSRRRICSSR